MIQYDESANGWCYLPALWHERQYMLRNPAPHEQRQIRRMWRICRVLQDSVNWLQWMVIKAAVLLGADRVYQFGDGQRSCLKWRPKR